MGKKYIIELEEEPFVRKSALHGETAVWCASGFNSLVFDQIGIDKLTPYTEPDMEQVRKEAYDKGYENGFVAGHLKAEKSGQSFYEDGYQCGLNDAREGKAYCQFCEYEMCSDRADPCRICACNYMNFFKSKKQEEMDGLRQNIQTIVDQCGYSLDEIAEVLQKMKES